MVTYGCDTALPAHLVAAQRRRSCVGRLAKRSARGGISILENTGGWARVIDLAWEVGCCCDNHELPQKLLAALPLCCLPAPGSARDTQHHLSASRYRHKHSTRLEEGSSRVRLPLRTPAPRRRRCTAHRRGCAQESTPPQTWGRRRCCRCAYPPVPRSLFSRWLARAKLRPLPTAASLSS